MNEKLEAIRSNVRLMIKNTPYSAAVLVIIGMILGAVFFAVF